jgi:hypothetical protein
MDQDDLRRHIEAATPLGLTSRIVHACWPGGAEDRTDRAALHWVRRWRPERLGAALPACSCAAGRCPVCN